MLSEIIKQFFSENVFWFQLAVVLITIAIGGRFGGVGLGTSGGFGLAILVLVFGMQPGSPPATVVFIIMAVITCVSVLQAAGGLDYFVSIAEVLLRKKPQAITFVGPLICGLFTFFCGTAYVAFSVYPVIAEVAAQAKIRPERPLSMSLIAADTAITASPMSAATSAMLVTLAFFGVSLAQLLSVIVPAVLLGIICGCLSVYKRGNELALDPEFQRRLVSGEYQMLHKKEIKTFSEINPSKKAVTGVILFALGIFTVVFLGSHKGILPVWIIDGKEDTLSTPQIIQIVMLATAFFIMVFCRIPGSDLSSGSVFRSGLVGAVAIFGMAWMTGTFFDGYSSYFKDLFSGMVEKQPILFGLILFCFSSVIFSPSVTVSVLMPVGRELGIPVEILVAVYPAVCGAFIIPGAGQIGCISFDRTGTTRMGRFVINHSFLRPGLVTISCSVLAAYFLAKIIL